MIFLLLLAGLHGSGARVGETRDPEVDPGQLIPIPDHYLDASPDAMGYDDYEDEETLDNEDDDEDVVQENADSFREIGRLL